MIQQSIFMQIFILLLISSMIFSSKSSSSSSIFHCSINQCYNTLPLNQTSFEKLSIYCNLSVNLFDKPQRLISIIRIYTIEYCTMKIFYFDQYTLWHELETISIHHTNLTYLSTKTFHFTNSLPILYRMKLFNISHNSLRKLPKNFSVYFPSLEKLDLSYNQLKYFHKKTFEHFLYLKELYLNHNYLQQIQATILPNQSIYLLNLNENLWHCTCINVLILSLSRPIPQCSMPIEYQHQYANDIARQCFLRTKANLYLSIDSHRKQFNLTCLLSSITTEWKSKIKKNLTIDSIWHVEQRRLISFEQLIVLYNQSEKYFICFNFNSTYSELIHSIIPLKLFPKQNLTELIRSKTFTPIFQWILKFSKICLPKSIQNSEKSVLIIWLILLALAISILIIVLKLTTTSISRQSRSLIRFDRNLHDHRTLLNVKLTCQNHKCLCQYRRRHSNHGTFYVSPTTLIESNQLRYAKIKRLSSKTNESIGRFRTKIQIRTLPN